MSIEIEQDTPPSTPEHIIKGGVLDYDQEFYRHLDRTNLRQYSIDDLLRILSVRGYDNKNPALWAGARRLMQQLSCEQIVKEKKFIKKQPPPYIRDAPFRERRHEIQKEYKQDVQEQRQERKQMRDPVRYEQPRETKRNDYDTSLSQGFREPKRHEHDTSLSQGFRRDKPSKYNRNFESA